MEEIDLTWNDDDDEIIDIITDIPKRLIKKGVIIGDWARLGEHYWVLQVEFAP